MDPFRNVCRVVPAVDYPMYDIPEDTYDENTYSKVIFTNTLGTTLTNETDNKAYQAIVYWMRTKKFAEEYKLFDKGGILMTYKGFPLHCFRYKKAWQEPSMYPALILVRVDDYRFAMELMQNLDRLVDTVNESRTSVCSFSPELAGLVGFILLAYAVWYARWIFTGFP